MIISPLGCAIAAISDSAGSASSASSTTIVEVTITCFMCYSFSLNFALAILSTRTVDILNAFASIVNIFSEQFDTGVITLAWSAVEHAAIGPYI